MVGFGKVSNIAELGSASQYGSYLKEQDYGCTV